MILLLTMKPTNFKAQQLIDCIVSGRSKVKIIGDQRKVRSKRAEILSDSLSVSISRVKDRPLSSAEVMIAHRRSISNRDRLASKIFTRFVIFEWRAAETTSTGRMEVFRCSD